MGFKEDFRYLFLFTRKERNALFVLLTLLFLSILGYFAIPYLVPAPKLSDEDWLAFQAMVDQQKLAQQEKQSYQQASAQPSVNYGKDSNRASAKIPASFNPNDLDSIGWQELGFSPKQVGSILNFKRKAGAFESKAQIEKLYVVSPEKYAQLEDHIALPKRVQKTAYSKPPTSYIKKDSSLSPQAYPNKRFEPFSGTVDINLDDTTALKQVPGIGSFFARSIVETREKMGGYHSLDQLLELYLMTPEKLDAWRPFLLVGDQGVKPIKVNSASKEEFYKHPYISYKQAEVIVAFRDKHGAFSKPEDLLQIKILNADWLQKVRPYLNCNQP